MHQGIYIYCDFVLPTYMLSKNLRCDFLSARVKHIDCDFCSRSFVTFCPVTFFPFTDVHPSPHVYVMFVDLDYLDSALRFLASKNFFKYLARRAH